MLRGIDISHHQRGIDLGAVLPNIDFLIAKATEGIDWTDDKCDNFIQQVISTGKPFGYYHFASNNDPVAECDYFIRETQGYLHKGIPILDWEGVYRNGQKVYDQSVSWVNEWVRHFADVTGVWPWIYGNPWRFNQGGVERNCGRWIAKYPNVSRPAIDYYPGEPPEVDGLVCAWQFASDGRVPGYDGNLDVNIFYGGTDAWNAYTGSFIEPEPEPTPEPEPEPEPEPTPEPEAEEHVIFEDNDFKITLEEK